MDQIPTRLLSHTDHGCFVHFNICSSHIEFVYVKQAVRVKHFNVSKKGVERVVTKCNETVELQPDLLLTMDEMQTVYSLFKRTPTPSTNAVLGKSTLFMTSKWEYIGLGYYRNFFFDSYLNRFRLLNNDWKDPDTAVAIIVKRVKATF